MADLKVPRINKFIVSGRIANDLELKFTPKGVPVIRFTLAAEKRYKDESDQWQSVTSWIDCVAWNKWAETLANNAHKGSALIVEGRVDTRNWTDSNNVNRKTTEVTADMIHFLEWKNRDEAGNAINNEVPLPPDEMAPAPRSTNDDVPF